MNQVGSNQRVDNPGNFPFCRKFCLAWNHVGLKPRQTNLVLKFLHKYFSETNFASFFTPRAGYAYATLIKENMLPTFFVCQTNDPNVLLRDTSCLFGECLKHARSFVVRRPQHEIVTSDTSLVKNLILGFTC